MKFTKKFLVTARNTPIKAWVAAILIPGGFVALGVWMSVKTIRRVVKKREKNDQS